MNPFDILGSLIQNGMGASKGRLDDTFGGAGGPGGGGLGGMFGGPGGTQGGGGGMFGGPGGMPGGGPAGAPDGDSGSLFDVLDKVLGGGSGTPQMPGGPGMPGRTGMPGGPGFPGNAGFPGGASAPGSSGPSPAIEILKQIAGAVLGGSGRSAGPGSSQGPAGPGGPFGSPGGGAGAAGSGLMAILAALAAKAMGAAIQQKGSATRQAPADSGVSDDLAAVLAGLRKTANPQEEKLVQDVAGLTIRAMINAAKADGRIDQQEAQRLVGKLQEDGLTAEDQRFVTEEIGKPMETDAIVRAVPNPQIGAQIYLASMMAIEADTDAERRYLQELAAKLGLNQQVLAYLHRSVGVA